MPGLGRRWRWGWCIDVKASARFEVLLPWSNTIAWIESRRVFTLFMVFVGRVARIAPETVDRFPRRTLVLLMRCNKGLKGDTIWMTQCLTFFEACRAAPKSQSKARIGLGKGGGC